MSPLKRLLVAAVVGLAAAGPGHADDDDLDHEQARRLVEQGEIRALTAITEEISQQVPGKLLEVEFEFEKGVYKYEFKILTPQGRVQEVEVDARTGRILKIEDDD